MEKDDCGLEALKQEKAQKPWRSKHLRVGCVRNMFEDLQEIPHPRKDGTDKASNSYL